MDEAVRPGGLASPRAVRWRRPGWRDPRLLVGLVLVALSVALGSSLVAAAGRTTAVYVAAGPLVAGDAVTADHLEVREVRLGDALDGYLRADADLPDGLVAVRTVDDGELVPLSAVAADGGLDLRPVAITPAGALSSAVVEGARVDLWFVPDADDGAAGGAAGDGTEVAEAAAPRELAAGLTVAELSEPGGAFAVGPGVTVHVLVPVADLGSVLAALAADGTIEVVPVPAGTTS